MCDARVTKARIISKMVCAINLRIFGGQYREEQRQDHEQDYHHGFFRYLNGQNLQIVEVEVDWDRYQRNTEEQEIKDLHGVE